MINNYFKIQHPIKWIIDNFGTFSIPTNWTFILEYKFPCWLCIINAFVTSVTQWVLHVEQELLTLLGQLGSVSVFRGFVLLNFSFLCNVLWITVCPSVLLRFTDSNYPFKIFKIFLPNIHLWIMVTFTSFVYLGNGAARLSIGLLLALLYAMIKAHLLLGLSLGSLQWSTFEWKNRASPAKNLIFWG